ncbi:hypothetical protein ABIB39_003082 [Mucilaginibacter sp. UYP27]
MIMRKVYFLLIAVALTSATCKKEKINTGKLPPITQTGENTFGATVNGKVFLPKVNFGNYTVKLAVSYSLNPQQLQMIANNTDSNDGFNFIFNDVSFNTGDIIQLSQLVVGKRNVAMAGYSITRETGGSYDIVPPLTGTLTVLKFDVTQKIFAGTFSFEAVNSLGEKVIVKDGRFDLKLQ